MRSHWSEAGEPDERIGKEHGHNDGDTRSSGENLAPVLIPSASRITFHTLQSNAKKLSSLRVYLLATGRCANKTGSNVGIILVEFSNIAGVLVVVNDLCVVGARRNDRGDRCAGYDGTSDGGGDARRRGDGTEGGAEHCCYDVGGDEYAKGVRGGGALSSIVLGLLKVLL